MLEEGLDYTKRQYPKLSVQGKQIKPNATSEMIVVIPTYLREYKQKAYYQFPKELRDKCVYLATKEERYDILQKANPGAKILKLDNSVHGIAATRQACIDLLPKGKIWMVDDLVKLQKRSPDFRVLGSASEEEVQELYDLVSHLLDSYTMVGVSGRPGNDKVREWKKDGTRVYSCYGLRTDVLEDLEIKFTGLYDKDNRLLFMEDFYLILSLLTKGYSNTCVYDYVANHSHNLPGGNSVLRDIAINNLCWQELRAKFPRYIRLVTLDRESWQGAMEGERLEGRISWKKAFTDTLRIVKPAGTLFGGNK